MRATYRAGGSGREGLQRRFASASTLVLVAGLSGGCLVSFSAPDENTNTNDNNNNDIPPGCGNGILESGEICDGTDFGGLTCPTAVVGTEFGELVCTESCRLDVSGCHSCGNGVIDAGEDCDDGSALAGDGCDERCRVEHGWVCEGEPSQCHTVCGDGLVVQGVEACDDGDTDPGDGCDESCTKEPGWACDGEPSVCAPTCGNGVINAGEDCDDGDAEADDGCSPSCEVEEGWTCDQAEPSGCAPICGDGLVRGNEACDDGGTSSGDGCAPDCTVEAGWSCAIGDPSDCAPICGDGLLRGDEACDDGDTFPGDGCSQSCQVEPYYACDSEPSQCSCVVYVNVNVATGTRSGDSWANAFASLRSALNMASMRAPCELWLAAGTYHAFEGSPGNSFDVRSNVSLYGGFTGVETRRDDRDWEANVTILDGANPNVPGQAVRTVVDVTNAQGALVDGVTIQGAINTASRGGGVAVDGGELTLRHSRVEGNDVEEGGAGIWVRNGDVTLLDVEVVGNTSSMGNGGGILLENGSVAVLDAVSVEDNVASSLAMGYGGGVYAQNSSLTVRSSQFLSNRAGMGGGVRVEQGGLFVENSLFVGNQAVNQGGGGLSVSQMTGAPWEIRSCTFYGNLATPGAGYALRVYGGTASVWNSILWGNLNQEIFLAAGGNANLDRCDIHESAASGTNLNEDPLFVNPTGGDFGLQAGSPCIDAANGDEAPGTDHDGNLRWDDPAETNTGTGAIPYADIGCFEKQP